MDGLSTQIILKALDALSMRATVTAQNIANANSPGYRPLKVTFEEALREAAKVDSQAIRSVSPQPMFAVDDQGGTELRLDLELATAASTAGRYGTLVQLLNRQLQMQALAVSGGR